jgi:hypothetical protein
MEFQSALSNLWTKFEAVDTAATEDIARAKLSQAIVYETLSKPNVLFFL